MPDALTALLLDALQLAHETQVPHQERSAEGGGVNVVLVVLGAVVTLAVVGALIWVKERTRKLEQREQDEAPAGAEGAS